MYSFVVKSGIYKEGLDQNDPGLWLNGAPENFKVALAQALLN